MAEIRWTSSSLRDLRGVLLFLADKDPVVAERYSLDFEAITEKINEWPRLGHQVHKYSDEIRERFVPPYRVVYRIINPELIEIVRVLHTHKPLPDDLERG